jgi:serine kinase of HPr protein (carbohydrate metabolism regulator)
MAIAADVRSAPTIHASAVLVGACAVLIRGAAGTGKSRLVLALLQAAQQKHIQFARLVGDDRIILEVHHGRLLARAPTALAGLIEVHGLGIRRVDYEPVAVVGLVVDLCAADANRLPTPAEREAKIAGLRLPRLGIAAGVDPLPMLLAALGSAESGA